MSDEEIDAEIDRLKQDPDTYQKRVDLLRKAYAEEEAAEAKLYEEQEQNRRIQDNAEFQNSYIQTAKYLDNIQGITLDLNDKEELLDFVLTKDAANNTGLSKAMQDPKNVLKMAWYLLHGEETFDATVDYFKNEISKRERNASSKPRVINKSKSQS
jgi:paraquat-inducible protein B